MATLPRRRRGTPTRSRPARARARARTRTRARTIPRTRQRPRPWRTTGTASPWQGPSGTEWARRAQRSSGSTGEVPLQVGLYGWSLRGSATSRRPRSTRAGTLGTSSSPSGTRSTLGPPGSTVSRWPVSQASLALTAQRPAPEQAQACALACGKGDPTEATTTNYSSNNLTIHKTYLVVGSPFRHHHQKGFPPGAPHRGPPWGEVLGATKEVLGTTKNY